MKYSVIVLAAGSGTRANLGYNKLLYERNGVTIIEEALRIFEMDAECTQILVTHHINDHRLIETLKDHPITLVLGGATRGESVYHALQRVQEDYVLIHDGARPYLEMSDLYKLKSKLNEVDAAILGVPVIDTIKIVKDGVIVDTPQRSTLWQAQTPQGFKSAKIKAAYQKAMEENQSFTDDASLVEQSMDVAMVEGSYTNKKVTTPEDFK